MEPGQALRPEGSMIRATTPEGRYASMLRNANATSKLKINVPRDASLLGQDFRTDVVFN
jgi:hypothetical protein